MKNVDRRKINKFIIRTRKRRAVLHVLGIKAVSGQYITTQDGKILYKSGS